MNSRTPFLVDGLRSHRGEILNMMNKTTQHDFGRYCVVREGQ